MASPRNYSNTGSDASAPVLLAPTDVTISLANYSGFPSAPYIAALDPDTVNEEIVLVTAVSGTTVTMTRAYDGTTPKTHAAGAVFRHVAAALDFREANDHITASTGVHGLTGAVVGTSDVQTLTGKTLTAPTISSPTVTGTLTGAGAAFSGSVNAATVTADSGAFTGNVTISGTPAVSTDAVTKGYADSGDGLNPANLQTGVIYTFVLADANREVDLSNASAITATIPNNAAIAFPVGTVLRFVQFDAGQVSVAGAAGVTVDVPPGCSAQTMGTGATVYARKRDTDHWVLSGQLALNPTASGHVASKGYVDTSAGTSAATASALARRDAAGRMQVAAPSVAADVATKSYVDAADTAIKGLWKVGGASVTSDASANVTITHALGVVPRAVFVQSRTVGVNAYSFVVSAVTATTFTYHVYYNGSAVTNNAHEIYWRVDA